MNNLLSISRRRGEPVPLGSSLHEYISKVFHQDGDSVREDCERIAQLRNKALDVQPHISSLDNLFEYYSNLCGIMAKFPLELNAEFVWHGSLGYTETGPVKSSSTKFEQLNILYNIGALYTQLALQALGGVNPDTNALKMAFNYYQSAAGCFRYIIDEILPKLEHAPPLDLDSSTHETLYYLCLAQAQEVFWKRAVMEGIKNTLVARLAQQVFEYYKESLGYANKSPAIKTEWMHHIACKRFHFQAAAQYRMAVECLEQRKYGEEIARLCEARDACLQAVVDSKYVSKAVLDDLQGLQSRVKSDLQRAETDNNLIYLEAVPSGATLPTINATPMAKAKVPEEIQNPIGYIENVKKQHVLFGFILPFAIYQASNSYQEKLVSYVEANIVAEADALSMQMANVLEELGLPGALEAVEKPEGLPTSLANHITEIQDRGGIDKVRATMDDIRKQSLESRHMLDESVQTLEYEEREDKMLRDQIGRARWTRSESRVSGKVLWDRITYFRDMLQQALEGDSTVHQDFRRVERVLEMMSAGPEHVEQMIPNSGYGNSNTNGFHSGGYLEHVMQELKETLLRSRGIENRRRERAQAMLHKARTANLLGNIIDEYDNRVRSNGKNIEVITASDFEDVYLNELRKFDNKWLQDERRDLANRISQIQQLNEEFLAARESDDGLVERENAIQSMEVAYIKFKTILRNLDEARVFYNGIIQQLQEYMSQCKDFVYQRRVEGRELEVKVIETGGVAESSSAKSQVSHSNVSTPTQPHATNSGAAANGQSSYSNIGSATPVANNGSGAAGNSPITIPGSLESGNSTTSRVGSRAAKGEPVATGSQTLWKPEDGIRFG